jgi:hypothetical protein
VRGREGLGSSVDPFNPQCSLVETKGEAAGGPGLLTLGVQLRETPSDATCRTAGNPVCCFKP